MPALVQGRIVFPIDAIPDPQGRNPKENRPFVVISSREDIEAGKDLTIVGVTKSVPNPVTDEYVELPFGPYALTKFQQRCAALCTWVKTLPQDAVEVGDGFVKPTPLLAIVKKVHSIDG